MSSGAINTIRSVVKLKDILGDGLIKTGEPQKAYMFEVEIIDNTNGYGYNNLKYYVKDVTVPSRSKDPIVIEYVGTKINWAGKDTASQLSINFWDDEDLKMTNFLHSWYNLSSDSIYGDSASKVNYTRDVRVKLKPTLDIGTTGSFVFRGCFPTQIGEITLSYDDSNVMEIPTTFAYDYMELEDADGNIIKSLTDLYGTVLGTGNAITDITGIF